MCYQYFSKSTQRPCANEIICILKLIPELPELNTKDIYDNIMINTTIKNHTNCHTNIFT